MRRRARRGRQILLLFPVAVVAIAGAVGAVVYSSRYTPRGPSARSTPARTVPAAQAGISYEDARPILDAFRDALPKDLRAGSAADTAALWPVWVRRHNAEIRTRLARGDEDSVVNLWLYGTTFTARPRATARDIAALGGSKQAAELLQGRLDDLLTGLAAPANNDRLRFARQVIERHGIDPTTPEGRDRAWDYLVDARARAAAENDGYRRALSSVDPARDSRAVLSVFSTLYQDRGLSSDTRIDADFSIDQALEVLGAKGSLGPARVRRVAIIGPGLDFTDKAEGYDFYPQQTIQPFAVLDSLLRLGLAIPADLQMVTFDLSARVNDHLEAARARAQDGLPYVLQLPLDRDAPGHQWDPKLVTFWQHVGGRIGDDVPARVPPPGASVQMRAVRVRPAVVLSIAPQDLNIVLERASVKDDERFDLIIATNILVYYDRFEQALALANVAAMLRPGGYFLTNYQVTPSAPMESSASLVTQVFWDRQRNGDTIFGYQRR